MDPHCAQAVALAALQVANRFARDELAPYLAGVDADGALALRKTLGLQSPLARRPGSQSSGPAVSEPRGLAAGLTRTPTT